MEDIDFNFKTDNLSKNNPEKGVIVKFHRFIVKKKPLNEGGVVSSRGECSESRSLCDRIHEILKDANERKNMEFGLKEIVAILRQGGFDGEDKERAEGIQIFLNRPWGPKIILDFIDSYLQTLKYPSVFSH